MEMGRKETKELEAAILGGEMMNAWQVEDRKGKFDGRLPDGRPPSMRSGAWNDRGSEYREGYERVFGK
jgi:hypothetical protein